MENSCRRLLATQTDDWDYFELQHLSFHSYCIQKKSRIASYYVSSKVLIIFGPMQNRRWGSGWNIFSCFGSHKQKRIGHAVLVPETSAQGTEVPAAENPTQATVAWDSDGGWFSQ